MMELLLYPLLATALYYLGSRAKITNWLWTRYPPGLASFMDCAACTGFWLGVFIELTFGRIEALLDFQAVEISRVLSAGFVAGLCMLVLTPLLAALMQHSLFVLGSAVNIEEPPNGDQ